MKKDITKFSRDFCKTVVAYGMADETLVRNHDIISDRKRGMTINQLAIKYHVHRTTIIRICNK
jgi:Mor family transcriptional regulator